MKAVSESTSNRSERMKILINSYITRLESVKMCLRRESRAAPPPERLKNVTSSEEQLAIKQEWKMAGGTNAAGDSERLKTVRSLYLTIFSMGKEVFSKVSFNRMSELYRLSSVNKNLSWWCECAHKFRRFLPIFCHLQLQHQRWNLMLNLWMRERNPDSKKSQLKTLNIQSIDGDRQGRNAWSEHGATSPNLLWPVTPLETTCVLCATKLQNLHAT